MKANKFFIEVDCAQAFEHGQNVSGDVYLQKKYPGRLIAVLSDGAGSGVKANIVASVISSMAINYVHSDESHIRVARAVVETFARGDHKGDTNQATFTIIDINDSGEVKIVEFDTPPTLFLRNGELFSPPKTEQEVTLTTGETFKIIISEFLARVEDRIVFYSDGITLSGKSTHRLPNGWSERGIEEMIKQAVSEKQDISASELCRKVVSRAEMNDLFVVKNDMSCGSIYFRNPRSILVCTGAPFDEEKDKYLAKIVDSYAGSVIISGGTTSQIIARELSREINVVMKRDPSGLPPVAMMEGVTLVTEGVLTLGKVKIMLETIKSSQVKGRGTDARIVNMLLEHDVIEFIVGTRINSLHQDPTLPVELELRRNVVKDIARILEHKFIKDVRISYI